MKRITSLFILFFTQIALATPTGDWFQSCHDAGDEDYIQQMALIDRKEFLWYAFAFEDQNCKSAYLIFSRKMRTIDLSKNEFEVNQVSYRSLTDEVTEALNMIGFCGFTNWKTHEDKIVTGKSCGDYEAPSFGTILQIPLVTSDSSRLFIQADPLPYERIQYRQ